MRGNIWLDRVARGAAYAGEMKQSVPCSRFEKAVDARHQKLPGRHDLQMRVSGDFQTLYKYVCVYVYIYIYVYIIYRYIHMS